MKQQFKLLSLCILISVILLSGCVRQPSGETGPNPTQYVSSETEPTKSEPQPTREPENGNPNGGDAQDTAASAPTKDTEPPATTEPTEATAPSDETIPAEDTKSTEPASAPEYEEDELPPMPVG